MNGIIGNAELMRLVGDIYHSVHDQDLWETVVDRLIVLTESRFALVTAADLRGKTYIQSGWRGQVEGAFEEGIAEYLATMVDDDPLLSFAVSNPAHGYVDSRTAMLLAGRDPDCDKYLDWTAARLGSGHNMVCYTLPTDGLVFGLSMNLPAGKPDFDPSRQRLFRDLFRHIDRAFRLAARLPELDQATEPMLVLSNKGNLLAANPAAEDLLRIGDGLRTIRGVLSAVDSEQATNLKTMLSQAAGETVCSAPMSAVAISRISGKTPLLVTASPLPQNNRAFARFSPGVLVRIIDRDAELPKRLGPDLVRLFELTATEKRLLLLMYNDELTLTEAADHLRMRSSTARVHMRHILGKVGVRNQVELMSLIQRLER